MVTNSNYKFHTSVSLDAYVNKEISGAMIGTSREEQNKIIRKQYGYAANKGIGYKESEETPSTLLDKMINGHVMCNLFNYTDRDLRTDGTFGSSFKKDSNFKGSYTIGVDIDHTEYTSVEDYIETLTFKPTFYYTSYSHLQEGKGVRFRMIYVFDEMIQNPYYFRYCAWTLNKQIELDTKEEIADDCNVRCSQYFNGTNKNTEGLNISYGITNNIYSFDDFGIDLLGFKDFLNNNCFYKTKSRKRTDEFKKIISLIDSYLGIDNNSSTTYYNEVENEDTTENQIETVEDFTKIDEHLINDMERLDYDEFMKYNRHKFPYFYRTEENEWLIDDKGNKYQFINKDSYLALYYNNSRVNDGCERRKKLYNRMCLRRYMRPDVDANTLLFNAYEDLNRFFENREDKVKNVITVDDLVRNVESAMNKSIEEIEEDFSDSIAYLNNKAPKKGIIYKTNKNKAISTVRSEVLTYLVGLYYNTEISVEDNINNLKDMGIEVGKSFIYKMFKNNNKSTNSNKLTDEEVIEILDVELSVRQNLQILKDSDIKIGKDRVARLLKEKKEMNKEAEEQVSDNEYDEVKIEVPEFHIPTPTLNYSIFNNREEKEYSIPINRNTINYAIY